MKKIKTTYKELHEKLGANPNQEFFVKTNTGSFAKIEATVHKKSNTYTVEFDNGVVFKAGDAHAFMDDTDSAVTVENLKPGQKIKTLDGTCAVTSVYNFMENQDVYDITVEAPHWYTNDDLHGIIHHNTSFALLMASAYLKKHKESVLMFYDSEFGSPQSYFESFGIDTSRVLHVPIKNIEELKFDLVNQLETIDRKDKVIIVIDSVGNLASKKELDDAMNEKSVADMTRAKSLKGLFRMVTPYLTIKNIPLLAINHTYATMEMFSKQVVSGGCFEEGTLVRLADGTNKPINEIVVGDLVITRDGVRDVTYTWDPDTLSEGEPDCYELEFEDGHKVVCSDTHPFAVNGQWVQAQDLTVGIECDII